MNILHTFHITVAHIGAAGAASSIFTKIYLSYIVVSKQRPTETHRKAFVII